MSGQRMTQKVRQKWICVNFTIKFDYHDFLDNIKNGKSSPNKTSTTIKISKHITQNYGTRKLDWLMMKLQNPIDTIQNMMLLQKTCHTINFISSKYIIEYLNCLGILN